MARLLVHVEGETEETFVNEILAPHLYSFGYTSIGARLIGNSRQRDRRGGIRGWNAVRRDILRHLNQDLQALASTMVDFYALPQSGEKAWPGRALATSLPTHLKAATVEDALLADLCQELGHSPSQSRFRPYLMMHEFEGLLFSEPHRFSQGIGRPELSAHFQQIRNQFASPEDINDSPESAPSKRILDLVPGYEKPLMGSLAILEIGLVTIRAECPLFNRWIERLEQWPETA
jgi:Domain of unknown function (DUF4276)